jgi:acetyl-CoA acetyltransferase
MKEPVILEAVHTPFGRKGGTFRNVRPDAHLAHALRGFMNRGE